MAWAYFGDHKTIPCPRCVQKMLPSSRALMSAPLLAFMHDANILTRHWMHETVLSDSSSARQPARLQPWLPPRRLLPSLESLFIGASLR